jgi:ABC-2 type transport system ATP-binding protein
VSDLDLRIEVTDASLAYRTMTNHVRSLKEFAVSVVRRQASVQQLWALRDASFTVESAELFAVVGRNGAGKSTLMKLLAGVLPPTTGRVIVRGRISPMIELTAGFDLELTARENVILNGTLLGRTVQEMHERLPAIVRWAELDEFVDAPLRTFSSGMLARLGFAVATDLEPNVLLVDEVLAVGDEAFQKKSRSRIEGLLAGGTTVVLVSHQLEIVRTIATRALWLDHGFVKAVGEAKEIVDAYRETL